MYARVDSFMYADHEPARIASRIEDQLTKNPDCNHIIAPMNTKMSTIACAMVAIRTPTVQLCYAEPNEYNYEKYSRGGDTHTFISFAQDVAAYWS